MKFISLILAAVLLSGCYPAASKPPQPIQQTKAYRDGILEVLYQRYVELCNNEPESTVAIAAAISRLQREYEYHADLSIYLEGSAFAKSMTPAAQKSLTNEYPGGIRQVCFDTARLVKQVWNAQIASRN